MPSLSVLRTSVALAATTVLLAACGGGNDDTPTPSPDPGLLTVTHATNGGLNGVWGNSALNTTDVEKRNPIGSTPELCAFKFDGAKQVGSSALAFGDVRYQSDHNTLYEAFFTFNGQEYASVDWSDTVVDRAANTVQVTNKVLLATDNSGARITLSAVLPLRGNRPLGC